jgi:hypothetical protein
MPAILHEGEAVVPKAYNPAAGGAGMQAELLTEIRALRASLEAGDKDKQSQTARLVSVIERWELNGIPEVRTA